MRGVNPQDFPRDFRFGVATSAYQVEGAAFEDGKGASIWDAFVQQPGAILDGSTGEVACDHYHRLEADLDLIAALGVNAYRFSISWPRVFPTGRGKINARGVDYYERLIDGLLGHGIEPWATLYHWDLPITLEEHGGWPVRDTAFAFAEYAERMANLLGDRVAGWITLNEPFNAATLGYGAGTHAPGRRNPRATLAAAHHMLLAHGLSVPILRANSRGMASSNVGIALSLNHVEAATDGAGDNLAARVLDGFLNRWFLDPIFNRGYPGDLEMFVQAQMPDFPEKDLDDIGVGLDFVGVNYYTRHLVRAPKPGTVMDGMNALLKQLGLPIEVVPEAERGNAVTEMGWEVYPDGLLEVLKRVYRHYEPRALVITENGVAFADRFEPDGSILDESRRAYLESHLEVALRALQEGVPLEGYFCWSLMDNFEWAEGVSKRFGLYHVDFASQERRLKHSGQWFRDVVRQARNRP
jgi:beta-glucosidase